MEIHPFYSTQRELKETLKEKHTLPEDLSGHYKLSFKQEIAEVVQLLRFFKFWSTKQTPQVKKVALIEESADCICFLIDYGIENKWSRYLKFIPDEEIHSWDYLSEVEIVNDIYESAIRTSSEYFVIWQKFLNLVYRYGITEDELHQGYAKKNNINHDRQKNGY